MKDENLKDATDRNQSKLASQTGVPNTLPLCGQAKAVELHTGHKPPPSPVWPGRVDSQFLWVQSSCLCMGEGIHSGSAAMFPLWLGCLESEAGKFTTHST